MADYDAVAVFQAEPFPCRLRQRRFLMRNKRGRDLIEGCYQGLVAVRNLHTGMGGKSFGAADCALPVHENDGFILGIEPESARAQTSLAWRTVGEVRGVDLRHDSCTCWP